MTGGAVVLMIFGIFVACAVAALLAMWLERWSDDRRRSKGAKAERKRWGDGPSRRD